MKSLVFVITVSLLMTPSLVSARPGGGARGGVNQPARPARPAPNQGRGFNLGNDVPSTRPNGHPNGNLPNAGNQNRPNNYPGGNNQNQVNSNPNRNNVNNGNYNNVSNKSNNTNVNRQGNTVNVTNNYNYNGRNGYGYNGRVVVNPVYVGPAWGWNRGVVWAPVPTYWGGGFWGAFAVGATTAAVMGSVVRSNQTYTSYHVSSGSPGSTLLSNYGLQQVQCGAPGLVVIYGPNNGVICANPNGRVAAGSYAVNADSLTLQSQ